MVAFAVRLVSFCSSAKSSAVIGSRRFSVPTATVTGMPRRCVPEYSVKMNELGNLVLAVAVGALEETVAPIVAAEFTIGDRLQPDALLQRYGIVDRGILDGAEGLGGDFAGLMIAPGLQQRGGAQHAADVVGMEGRIEMGSGHGGPRFLLSGDNRAARRLP